MLITALAGFLRLWQLTDYQQRMSQDELVVGYDAWSIWLTRRDQYGAFLPIHFRTFNDYVPPVANYLTAPFVGLLGLSEFSTRLPFALLGTASVLVVGLLGYRLLGRAAGLLAALLLAFEPWHLNYSRTAFPASLLPFFSVCAVYFFVEAILSLRAGAKKPGRVRFWLVASGLSFGLLFMSYPIEKLNAPVLALVCFAAAARLLWKNKALLAIWVVAGLVTASPVIYEQLFTWNTLQNRFNDVSIFAEKDWWLAYPRNYSSYYNPSLLFFDGFKAGVSLRISGIGQLFWIELGLWLVALVKLVRLWRNSGSLNVPVLLLGWFATFPLAASFTTTYPHETRSLNFLPLPELLAAYGAVVAWRGLRPVARAGFVGLIGLLFAVNVWVFLTGYFPERTALLNLSPDRIPANVGFGPIAREAANRLQPCDTLWVDDFLQGYIYYLFDNQYPPSRYQQDDKALKTGPKGGYVFVRWFGQVYIGMPRAADYLALPQSLKGCPDSDPTKGKVYWITRLPPDKWPETRLPWEALQVISNAKGEPLWTLAQLKQ